MENFDKNELRIIVIEPAMQELVFATNLGKAVLWAKSLLSTNKGRSNERPPLSKNFLLESEDTIKPIYLLKELNGIKNKRLF